MKQLMKALTVLENIAGVDDGDSEEQKIFSEE